MRFLFQCHKAASAHRLYEMMTLKYTSFYQRSLKENKESSSDNYVADVFYLQGQKANSIFCKVIQIT